MPQSPVRFRIFVEPQEGATYADQLALARLAEQLGFDAFFRSDHYIAFFGGTGLPGPTDVWTTIAGLARETTSIRLGTLVSPVTFRIPGPFAIAVAQIDAMSNGRIEVGLGAGWNDQEHAAYGIPFPDLTTRLRAARRAARDPHRAVERRRGRTVHTSGSPLHADQLARVAEAGPATPPPDRDRWWWAEAHTAPGRVLRQRIQRGVRATRCARGTGAR